MRARVLVVDSKDAIATVLLRALSAELEVTIAPDGTCALDLLASQPFDVVIGDLDPRATDRLALLREAHRVQPDAEVIFVTASVKAAVVAVNEGAYDYLRRPLEPDEALLVVRRAAERKQLRMRARTLEIGRKLAYRDMLEIVRERATRDYLIALMKDVAGNVTQAAERARIERESMHRLLRKHGVRSEDFKSKSPP